MRRTVILSFLCLYFSSIPIFAQYIPDNNGTLWVDLGMKSNSFVFEDWVPLEGDNGKLIYEVRYTFTLTSTMLIEAGMPYLDYFISIETPDRYLLASLYPYDDDYLSRLLPPGNYEVSVVTFGIDNQLTLSGTLSSIVPEVGSTPYNAIDIGTISEPFAYVATKDASHYEDYQYNDVEQFSFFHRFTIIEPMDVSISHCGSQLFGCYCELYEAATGNYILDGDHYQGERECDYIEHGYLKVEQLPAGTYYIVSFGGSVFDGTFNTRVVFSLGDDSPDPGSVDDKEPPPPIDGKLSLSADHNYIYTITPTAAVSTTDYITLDKSVQTVQYFDGLGRPIETVQRGLSPTKRDLVSYQEYDAYGREANTWLPVSCPSYFSGGSFVPLSRLPIHIPGSYGDETKPYSKPVYEASPLNRILEQYGPGERWHNTGKSIRTHYLTNVAGNDTLNCIYFTANAVEGDTAVIVNQVNNYASGQLFVTRIQNEDGNTSLEFKDKLERVILTRQIQRESNNKFFYDTYYIYDDFGNLHVVLPPIASDSLALDNGNRWDSRIHSVLKNYVYLYKYDYRNRTVAKKLPGCSWTYYVYDKADRLIFTQDGEQRARSEWSFSIPDIFGRPCLTGICKNSLNALSLTPPLNSVVVAQRNNTNSTYKGYSLSSLTLLNSRLLSVNYYDDYSFLNKNVISEFNNSRFAYDSSDTAFNVSRLTTPKTLLTGTLTAKLDDSTTPSFLGSVNYYDTHSRVIQTLSDNHLAGMDKEYIAYNFIGQPLKRKHVHKVPNRSTWTETYGYSYDHGSRLIKTTHQLTEVTAAGVKTEHPLIVLARNTYDELGRLISVKSNNQVNLYTEYTYNIRSWMKEISNPLFSECLDYSYSGNIQTQEWDQANKTRKYTFAYDHLSMLKSATFSSPNGGNYSTSYNYDKHGNIQTLSRYGNTGTSTFGKIDDLTLSYHGNQLRKVEDRAINPSLSSSMDFRNGSNMVKEYFYDRNGNMTKDLNKGISGIEYNLLNLPKRLTISNSYGQGTNVYLYAANGQKLRVTKNTHKTDYVGSFIYENDSFKRLLVDNGYFEGGKYYFYVRDHLGNNRIVTDQNSNIVQSTQYYPFGMSYADGVEVSKQPYRYNGKELDGEKGLNWYDYEMRQLSLDVPRFTRVDPMAEKYYSISPYAYVANNPMRFVDPTGMFLTDYEIDKEGYIKRISEIDDKPDRLFGINQSTGDRENIIVNDKSILNDLSGKSNFKNKRFPEEGKIVKTFNSETGKWKTEKILETVDGHAATTSSSKEAKRVFEFAAKASDVEWGLSIYKNGKAVVGTVHENSLGPLFSPLGDDFKFENQNYRAHSHSGTNPSVDFVPSNQDIRSSRSLRTVNPSAQDWLYMPKNPNKKWMQIK